MKSLGVVAWVPFVVVAACTPLRPLDASEDAGRGLDARLDAPGLDARMDDAPTPDARADAYSELDALAADVFVPAADAYSPADAFVSPDALVSADAWSAPADAYVGPDARVSCIRDRCERNQRCTSGVCVCLSDYLDCVASEPGCETRQGTSNCGRCGVRCTGAAPYCTSGVCSVCPAGDTSCGGSCVNTDDDESNCGGCGRSCAGATPYCVAGMCSVCPAGETSCGGRCVDTRSDPLHCGDCSTVCAGAPNASPRCAGSGCGLSCDVGFGDCDGMSASGCERPLGTGTDCSGCGDTCVAPAVCMGNLCT